MIQKEFAEKLWVNFKKNNKYGQLSVVAQGIGSIKKIMDLSPLSFNPAPKVHSQVIYYENLMDLNMKGFMDLLNEAFSNPRKQLKNNIKTSKFLESMDVNWLMERPENLSPQQYVGWFKKSNENQCQ